MFVLLWQKINKLQNCNNKITKMRGANMCLVFGLSAAPWTMNYPAANRDEFYARPTARPLLADYPDVLA